MVKGVGFMAAMIGVCLAVALPNVMAADFPAKDITLICPWAAGSGTACLTETPVKKCQTIFRSECQCGQQNRRHGGRGHGRRHQIPVLTAIR